MHSAAGHAVCSVQCCAEMCCIDSHAVAVQIYDLETRYLEACNPNANALTGRNCRPRSVLDTAAAAAAAIKQQQQQCESSDSSNNTALWLERASLIVLFSHSSKQLEILILVGCAFAVANYTAVTYVSGLYLCCVLSCRL